LPLGIRSLNDEGSECRKRILVSVDERYERVSLLNNGAMGSARRRRVLPLGVERIIDDELKVVAGTVYFVSVIDHETCSTTLIWSTVGSHRCLQTVGRNLKRKLDDMLMR